MREKIAKLGSSTLYERGTLRVIAIACVAILLAVALSGMTNYWIAKKAVVDKLKSRDFVYIVESIASKVDDRIERAKETSLLLADDRVVVDWLMSGETDERLGNYAKARIDRIAALPDYANANIVSARTRHYWMENFQLLQTMDAADPESVWFFDGLKSGKKHAVLLDYDPDRQGTFIFLNTLVGDLREPVGMVGIGLDLSEIEGEFQKYKIGAKSKLWLVDGTGEIYLSDDLSEQGKFLTELIPENTARQITQGRAGLEPQVMEYRGADGEIVDIACRATRSTDWSLVFQMPRSENTGFLNAIRFNTLAVSAAILAMVIFVFYFISRKMANPLRQAMLLNEEMQRQAAMRTEELAEKNQEIMDSIAYARNLQQAMLPAHQEMAEVFADFYVLWRPRDVVGGDFYWLRRLGGAIYFALGDCTGHGVPGACMTMAAQTALNAAIDRKEGSPAEILARFHDALKQSLHRSGGQTLTDDGLDIGLCKIEGKRLAYAGAHLPLYIKRDGVVTMCKGARGGVGYRMAKTPVFEDHVWELQTGDRFYLSSDGYLDQNGGSKNHSLGRKRFIQTLETPAADMTQKGRLLEHVLDEYQGTALQRDDITVIGFEIKGIADESGECELPAKNKRAGARGEFISAVKMR